MYPPSDRIYFSSLHLQFWRRCSTYLIVAPRQIRPDLVVQVYVSVFEYNTRHLTINAAITKDGHSHTHVSATLTSGSSRLLQMKVGYFNYE